MIRRAWVPAFVFFAGCGDAPAAPATPAAVPAAVAPHATASAHIALNAPPAVPSVPAPPPSPPACVIRGRAGVLVRPVAMRYHGKRFGNIDMVKSAEVQLAPPPALSSLRATTDTLEFNGEILLNDLFVAPNARQVFEGWYVVEALRVHTVVPGELTGTSSLPALLSGSRPIESKVRCDTVGATVPDWVQQRRGSLRVLKGGAQGDLRESASGKVLGQLTVPQAKTGASAQLVGVLEEAGNASKIAVRGPDLTVEAWVDSAMLVSATSADGKKLLLAAQSESMQMMMLAVLGSAPPNSLACPSPVPVYVRDGAERVAVATLLPGAPIKKAAASDAPGNELGIDLGVAQGTDTLLPFVLRADVDKCPEARVSANVASLGETRPVMLAPNPSVPPGPGLNVSPNPSSSPVKALGPKADVNIGSVSVSGSVAGADRVIGGLRPRFRACYQTGLNADPGMRGTLVVRAETAGDGGVTKADIVSNAGLSPAVASCVANSLRRAVFSGAGSVSASVVFSPTE